MHNAALSVVVLADLEPDARVAGQMLKESAPHMSAYADMLPDLLPIYAGKQGKNTITEASIQNYLVLLLVMRQ